jgi:hypothetical protein
MNLEQAIPFRPPSGTSSVFFWPLLRELGKTKQLARRSEFDVRATLRLNKLYTTLPTIPDGERQVQHVDMNHFMARLIFLFFAEDAWGARPAR